MGNGKGIATYYKKELFTVDIEISHETAQIAKFRSEKIDIIHVYRSNTHKLENLTMDITDMIEENQATLIAGDFNVCNKRSPKNKLNETLINKGFTQLVTEATHIQGGTLDHVYYRNNKDHDNKHLHIARYSPYYSDHDYSSATPK